MNQQSTAPRMCHVLGCKCRASHRVVVDQKRSGSYTLWICDRHNNKRDIRAELQRRTNS